MKVRWKEAYRVQSEITTKEPKRKRQVLEITVNGDKQLMLNKGQWPGISIRSRQRQRRGDYIRQLDEGDISDKETMK